jgi:dienelactone hydrolase
MTPLAKALAKPLIAPELSTRQVQHYIRSRIAKMPNVATADAWQAYADDLRQRILNEIMFVGEARKWRDAPARVEWLETIDGGPGYSIRKLRYEVLPGLWVPALLYRPDLLPPKTPVVLNVNGHDADGKQAPYKQIRCINQAKRGMLALNVEWFNMGQLRGDNFNHYRLNQIDLCGTSGLAPFLLSMMRGLDILLALPNADPDRVAVAGLSGGGWQTIVISALDPRVTLADPVAGYSSFHSRAIRGEDLGDSEQTPSDLAALADYVHLTAMRAPRPTLLTYNFADNCCFFAGSALPPLLEGTRPIYRLFGKEDHLRWHVNYEPGDHNFQQDNRVAMYFMFRDFFYPGDSSFDPEEIPSDAEVKSKEDLAVELPSNNLDFHQLATSLAQPLPRTVPLPDSPKQLAAWQHERRDELRRLVRYQEWPVQAQVLEEAGLDLAAVRYLRLHATRRRADPPVPQGNHDPDR